MAGVPIYEQGCRTSCHPDHRGLLSFHTSNKGGHRWRRLCLSRPAHPEGEDGRADLKYVHAVVDELANEVGEDTIFVVKSNRPPGRLHRSGSGWPTWAARRASSPTPSSTSRGQGG